MIKGLGNDIVKIARIEQMIEKYGDHFLKKIFSEKERLYCLEKANPAIHFSGRWAVKEAFYKALPQECQKISSWQSIETISSNGIFSHPKIKIICNKLKNKMVDCDISYFHVTISHENEYCVGTVILE